MSSWALGARVGICGKTLSVLISFLTFGSTGVANAQQAMTWTPVKPGWLYVLDQGEVPSGPRIYVVDPVSRTTEGFLNIGGDSFGAEMALSPDGDRLYVLRISAGPGLLVFDTSSGRVIQEVLSPPKIQFTTPSHAPTLAVSPDGKWLYMATMYSYSPAESITNDVYSVATFDTRRGMFLDHWYSIVNCGPPVLLPRKNNHQLEIICHGSNTIYGLAIESGDLGSLARRVDSPKSSFADERTASGQRIQTGVIVPGDRLVIATGNGRIFAERASTGDITHVDQIPDCQSDGRQHLCRSWTCTRRWFAGRDCRLGCGFAARALHDCGQSAIRKPRDQQ